MSAGIQKGRRQLNVAADVYDELVRLQAEWEAEHTPGKISLGEIIKRLLAARPVQP